MKTMKTTPIKAESHAFIISLCLHLILFILIALFWLRETYQKSEETVSIELVEVDKVQRKPTFKNLMSLIKPALLTAKPAESFGSEPQFKSRRLFESSSPINEAIFKGSDELRQSAALQSNFKPLEIIPDAATSARLMPDSRSTIQPSEFSTPALPTSAQGVQSSRQVVKGKGKGGLSMVYSSGSTDEGLVSSVSKSGKGEEHGSGGSGKGAGGGTSPFGAALSQIAERQVESNKSGKLDLVFVIDASGSMHDNIDKVADNLYRMIDEYESAKIEYRIGVVEFQEQQGINQIRIQGLTVNPSLLQHRLKSMSVVGNEHAIDALMKSIEGIQFRTDSDKRMLLVTDEPATTSWGEIGAQKLLSNQIVSECKNRDIKVDVLGFDEMFQKEVAQKTGGIWLQIPSEEERYRQAKFSNWTLPSDQVSKLFRSFASQAARKSGIMGKSRLIDIVLIVDCSLSMSGKSEAILQGISAMISLLNTFLDIDYQIGLVRFAERGETLGGIDHISISQPPLNENELMVLLQYAYKGDERLIDAIVEGLPKIRFRLASNRYALIATDEPSTGRYSWHEALKTCQNLSVQVSVIGSLPAELENSELPVRTDEIQMILPNQTGGTFKAMPNSLKEISPKW